MDEKTLIIICIIVSVLGLAISFLSSKFFEPEVIKISEIKGNMKYLSVEGELIKFEKSGSGTHFLKIEDDSGVVDAVAFKNSVKNIENLKQGDIIRVSGVAETYKGSVEIICKKIIKLT